MAIEREIKLSIPMAARRDLPRQIAAYLDTLPDSVSGGTQHLINRYFDTADSHLAQVRAALRLRHVERDGTAGQWLQTLKAAGHSADGLHTRHEWEMPVAAGAFDLDALQAVCDLPDVAALLRAHGGALQPLFETNFTRRLWHVTVPQARLEIALDDGDVAVSQQGVRHAEPLREVEIELVDATPEAESALRAFADALLHRYPALQPNNISKAERGYELRQRVLTHRS